MNNAVEWNKQIQEYARKITLLACCCQLPRYLLKTELVNHMEELMVLTRIRKLLIIYTCQAVKHSAYTAAVHQAQPSQPTKPRSQPESSAASTQPVSQA